MQPHYVKVEIRCGAGGSTTALCVRVDRGVPPRLRCTPSGGGSAGSSSTSAPACRRCEALLTEGGTRLSEQVHQLVARGWDAHLRSGAVLISC
jgi:hypothetical protein